MLQTLQPRRPFVRPLPDGVGAEYAEVPLSSSELQTLEPRRPLARSLLDGVGAEYAEVPLSSSELKTLAAP